jgi:acetyl esterase/lipase
MVALTDARVQAFVGWYGPYNIETMLARSIAAAKSGQPMSAQARAETEGGLSFFGCTIEGCPPDVARPASPLNFVDSGDPPTLLIHGSADNLVPPDQSERLAAAMRKAGVPVQLLLLPGADHGWTSATPDATAANSRRAARITFDWLEKRFAK